MDVKVEVYIIMLRLKLSRGSLLSNFKLTTHARAFVRVRAGVW